MNTDSPPTTPRTDAHARAVVVDGFKQVTETFMKDKPWEYNRRVYEIWRIFDPWPDGFLLHMAGPTDEGVVIQAIWRDAAAEASYMAEIGIERYTEIAHAMAGERPDAPADLLPQNLELRHLSFGPLAARFIDIGPDLDESSGKQLGTVMTAVDLEYAALSGEQTEQLWREAGLGATVPGDLIMRAVFVRDGGLVETQLWASEDAARGFVERTLAPAAAPAEVPARYREIKRIAISSSGLDPARF